jgi:virginiamycin B lyase
VKRHYRISRAAAIAALALYGCSAASQGSASLPVQPGAVARAASGPKLRVFTAGKAPGFPKGSVPFDITLGPDGAMWFTDGNVPGVGRIDSHGNVVEYTKGLDLDALPYSIVNGPDGNLWFSDAKGSIGHITTSGKIVESSVTRLTNGGAPLGIAATAKGTIWSIVIGPPSVLVRVDRSGALSAVNLPKAYEADGSLTADASGNLWMMTRQGEDGIVLERKTNGRWTPWVTHLTDARLPCCPNRAPKRIVADGNGDVWFTTLYWLEPNVDRNVIGKIVDSRTVLYPVNDEGMNSVYPSGIAATDANVWFVGDNPLQIAGGLWMIRENGTQTGYSLPHNPIGIAGDAGGNLWFTAEAFDLPGQIVEAVSPGS